MKPAIPASLRRAAATLRSAALAYPETKEDFPWGEQAFKVRGKVFLFLHCSADRLGLSVKLPSSNGVALIFPFASPTGYGLGASGWVSARFGPKDRIPLETLRIWLEESYCAVAPKKLSAALAAPATTRPGRKPARRESRSRARS
ncbi:MAG: MmcQ/YjbR family DNA-binding protein [Gemmatimonadales bacterium]